MESEILDLIQTDQKTREAVEEAHRMKFELKRKIADTEKTRGRKFASGSTPKKPSWIIRSVRWNPRI